MTNDLAQRQEIEKKFHDSLARSNSGTFYDFGALDLPDEFLIQQLGDVRGMRIVEIGCGHGINSVAFAQAGAEVIALDISAEMVAVTNERAAKHNLSDRIKARVVGIEELDLEEGSCDIVYGHSVLHHLDLDVAMPLIARVLRKGGLAAFLDPLDHNPLLNYLRKLTPNIRTPTEKPLSLNDIARISQLFAITKRTEFHFISLAAFFWYYVFRNEQLFRITLSALSKLDRALFRIIPFSRRFAWVTVIIFTK